jgi:hypothetical protein
MGLDFVGHKIIYYNPITYSVNPVALPCLGLPNKPPHYHLPTSPREIGWLAGAAVNMDLCNLFYYILIYK